MKSAPDMNKFVSDLRQGGQGRRFEPHLKYTRVEGGWLEQIPAHWQLLRVRRRLLPGTEGVKIGPFGSSLRLEMMSESGFKVYGQENVIYNDFSLGQRFVDKVKFDELREYRLRSGDVLVTMAGTTGRCQCMPERVAKGIMDSHLLRLRFQPEKVDRKFIALTIDQSPYIRAQMITAGRGSTMHGLNSSILKDLVVALDEQRAIAAFLDRETARIDELVKKMKRLIELLKEKRSALISRLVTKGLDPDAPMKGSRVQWLGDTPAHWRVKRLKYSLKDVEQGWSPSCETRPAESDEWGVMKVSCVNAMRFRAAENKALPKDLEPILEFELRLGDVLMSRANTRELLGSVALVDSLPSRLLLCDKLYRLSFAESVADSRLCASPLFTSVPLSDGTRGDWSKWFDAEHWSGYRA